MHTISAERRFSILLFVALAALIALASSAPSFYSAEASSQRALTVPRGVVAATPLDPPRPLEALWLTDLETRFPDDMKPLLASRYSLLTDHQIVSYYGNPYSALMGIIGAGDPEDVADLLEEHAAEYDRLNGERGVIPAIHLVYGVAQPHPTDNGLYLQYLDDEMLQRILDLADERGMLVFLDLQIGQSSVADEIEKVLPYLQRPNVHLALDPEFAVSGSDKPGDVIGNLDAEDINTAQAMLQDLVVAERLPPKLLMVHQFLDSMILNGHAITHYHGVELIIDMDGFGTAPVKRSLYERYASQAYTAHAAIKLFFDYDDGLMSEQDILGLEPMPAVIIYQ